MEQSQQRWPTHALRLHQQSGTNGERKILSCLDHLQHLDRKPAQKRDWKKKKKKSWKRMMRLKLVSRAADVGKKDDILNLNLCRECFKH